MTYTFCGLPPFSTGISGTKAKRDIILNEEVNNILSRGIGTLQGIIIGLRERSSGGYEWRLYTCNRIDMLLTHEARVEHCRLRRETGFRFFVQFVLRKSDTASLSSSVAFTEILVTKKHIRRIAGGWREASRSN